MEFSRPDLNRDSDDENDEKYRRPDYGHLQTELTFDDTTLYTKPFTVKINYEIVTDNDIFEMFCGQNEKDRQHMVTGPTSMVTEK